MIALNESLPPIYVTLVIVSTMNSQSFDFGDEIHYFLLEHGYSLSLPNDGTPPTSPVYANDSKVREDVGYNPMNSGIDLLNFFIEQADRNEVHQGTDQNGMNRKFLNENLVSDTNASNTPLQNSSERLLDNISLDFQIIDDKLDTLSNISSNQTDVTFFSEEEEHVEDPKHSS
ncbi:hypothetical protein L596_001734 [Steinernema carpocapsae]|uniref:Uncharacterized protein n=1 Tax=Steinernema carpocapsae TaxID=34508 RepID=A0A4U8UMC9_STECR|nr:hypothetical protein L596_001734 [Steinernema carpocapsae]